MLCQSKLSAKRVWAGKNAIAANRAIVKEI
jgi:hypothetical protein